MKRYDWILLVLTFIFLSACGGADSTAGLEVDGDSDAHDNLSGVDDDSPADGDDPDGDDPDGDDPSDDSEQYEEIVENAFLSTETDPFSTFSIDVDTASYSNVRRFLENGRMPPPDAVRIEEMVNYFDYDYEPPDNEDPFAVYIDSADCPWKNDHNLIRIALKGKLLGEDRPPSNLVFLLDVSGSMSSGNKLPLLKRAFKLLVEQLDENDRVAIVVYAGASGLVLPSTTCDRKHEIIEALDDLQAGGSTAGAAGIEQAYSVAMENFLENGNNRVILATDGDFNVGLSSDAALQNLIEEKAETGVLLSVYGFGMGNLNDSMLEKLSNHGNGSYGYIDSYEEAQKVFVYDILGTLYTIAKDVKIQVEFNPEQIVAYRLLGYENRMLNYDDFNDDTKDAGEIGSGHSVTAFYQVVPVGSEVGYDVEEGEGTADQSTTFSNNTVAKLHLRHKAITFDGPAADESILATYDLSKNGHSVFDAADVDFRFASMVASFGMLLRGSAYCGDANYQTVHDTAAEALGADVLQYRAEFLELVSIASDLRD